ncbi:hypothetical protein GCM10025331_42420 [Actinoplanes utahensis]
MPITGYVSGAAPAVPGLRGWTEIGRGAHSVVYRAVRPDGAEVAVKVLPDGAARTPLYREAAWTAICRHPGLPEVYDAGEVDGRPYLVMELVTGNRLGDLLRAGRLTPARVALIGADIAEALTAVHRAGLVHRDVKPDNVMVGADGRARLVDLGMAARSGELCGDEIAGTLTYTAPEQNGSLRRPVDARSDLYSLGVVLYECLAGRPPFRAADTGELMRLHAVAAPPALPAPEGNRAEGPLAAVVARLLAKDPDDRYAGAPGLAADLRSVAAAPDAALTVGAADRPVTPAEPPLAGRERELGELAGCWARIRDGARVAVIRGEAGLGRSRLLREFAGRLHGAGVTVLRGAGRPGDPPLAVLSQMVDALAARAEPDLLRAAAGAAAPYLGRLSPVLRKVVNVAPVLSEDSGAYPRAVAAFLAGLARQSGGAVLAIDDAHWLDDTTAQVLRQVLTQHATAPLLILVTTDTGVPVVWGGEDAAGIVLEPLDDTAARQQFAAICGGYPVAAGLPERFAARAGGRPLTLSVLLRGAIDAGVLVPRDGRLHIDSERLQHLQIPDDLEGLLLSRIDGLGAAGREMLTAAAIVGLRFDAGTAALVAGRDEAEARDCFGTAAGRGILEDGDGGYWFVHERVHRALLGALTPERRRDLHQRAAEVTAGEAADARARYATARHRLAGHPGRAPRRTVSACLAAARSALGEHAALDAIGFLEAARPYADGADPVTADALTEVCGRAYAQAGRLVEAEEQFRAALGATADPMRRAGLHEQLAQLHLGRWQIDRSLREVELGLAALGADPARGPVRRVVSGLGYLLGAVLVERTRIGFGTADPDRLARRRQLFALYAAGSYAALLSTRLPLMADHELRARYAAARIGPSEEYIRQVGHNAALQQSVTRRPAKRSFARAGRVAAELGSPAGAAYVEYLRRLTETQTGDPDLDEYLHWLRRHSALLTPSDNLNLALAVSARHDLRGRRARTHAAVEQAFGYLGAPDLQHGAVSRLYGAGGTVDLDDAAALLDEPDAALGGGAGRLMPLVTIITAAYHQHEFGDVFDRATTAFRALRIRPLALAATLRTVYVAIAYGRLEQLRGAGPEQRAAATAEAGRAVRDLRDASIGGRGACRELAAHHALVTAMLAWDTAGSERARRRARDLLVKAERRAGDHDVPAVTAGTMLMRARIAAYAGRAEEAAAHAGAAVRLAGDLGMLEFAYVVRREFGVGGDVVRRSATEDGTADRRRLAALERLSRTVSGMIALDALSRAVLDETVLILNAERAYLFLADDDDRLLPFSGRDAHGADLAILTDYGSTIVERVWRTGEPVVVTGTDEGAALGSASVVLHGLRSIMAAPLVLDGRMLGVVYLDSRVAKGMFTGADVGILSAITQHVAAAVETARAAQLAVAVRAAEQQRDMADMLRESLIRFSRSLDPAAVLAELHAALARVLPADGSWLVRASEDGDLALIGAGGGPLERSATLNALLAAPGPVAVTADLGFSAGAHLAVPLHRQGTPVGLVLLTGGSYGPTEITLAAALAEEAMVVYDNAALFARVEYLATTDALTGVSNRRHFFTLAEAMAVASGGFTAVMADIDHFKKINDRYGHQVGDQVITAVAARLRDASPPGGQVGRYGGEEFAAVWPGLDDPAGLAERLRRAVTDRPVETDAGPLTVTVSVGVCPATTGLDAALRAADAALYRAKRDGRDRVACARPAEVACSPV